jgi:predicted transcriptional regulator
MFCGQLISHHLPSLHLHDKVSQALQLMADHKVSHLPVVTDEKYIGLVSEDDLLEADENMLLESLSQHFSNLFVRFNDHFLLAAKVMVAANTDTIPVLTESDELEGSIGAPELARQLALFSGVDQEGSIIVLELERKAYAFGEINRLVESNDAIITQINTAIDPASQIMVVTLRINKNEVSDVVATLQRHDYNVKYYHGEELYRNELQTNLEHLMNYLSI